MSTPVSQETDTMIIGNEKQPFYSLSIFSCT